VQNKKKTLIILGPNPSLDAYICTGILITILKENNSIDLHYASKVSGYFKQVFQIPDSDNISIIDAIPPKNFVLEFSGQNNNKVDKVQWNQSNDKLSLYLTMESGTIDPSNLEFKITDSDYQEIIIFGTQNLHELTDFYSKAKAVFLDTNKLIFSDSDKFDLPKTRLLKINQFDSLAGTFFTYLKEKNYVLSKELATLLMSCYLYATKDFTQKISAKTFRELASLAELGADSASAKKTISVVGNSQSADLSQKSNGFTIR